MHLTFRQQLLIPHAVDFIRRGKLCGEKWGLPARVENHTIWLSCMGWCGCHCLFTRFFWHWIALFSVCCLPGAFYVRHLIIHHWDIVRPMEKWMTYCEWCGHSQPREGTYSSLKLWRCIDNPIWLHQVLPLIVFSNADQVISTVV